MYVSRLNFHTNPGRTHEVEGGGAPEGARPDGQVSGQLAATRSASNPFSPPSGLQTWCSRKMRRTLVR